MNWTHRARCAWVCLAAFAASAPANTTASTTASTTDWKPLFNGKNLKGWSVHYASKAPDGAPSPANLFEVNNGQIHIYPDAAAGSAQPFAYLITDAEYRDYRLTLEYKWGEKKFAPRLNLVRDSGL